MDKFHRWEDFLGSSIDGWQHHFLGELFSNRQEKNRLELPLLAVTGSAGVIDRDKLERRDTSNADKSKYLRVATGDIVYNTMRMWQGVSGSAHKDGIVSPAYTVATPTNLLDKRFAKYLVKNELLIQKFHQNSQGLVDDTLNLKFPNFASIHVQIASIPEQKKIASILTSVDTVIENTQKQIGKLQDLKKATMNELLTKGIGHTKLKVSKSEINPDGWFIKTVGNIGSFFNGLNNKTSQDFGQGKPFLTYLQVFNKTLSAKEQAGLVSIDEGEKQEKVQYGDILFTTSSETPDEVGMTAVFLEKDWSPYLNSFCFGIRPKEEFPLNPEFANHFFRGDKFRNDMRPLAQGSTRFNLSKENLKKLSVTLPPVSEQKKIAPILSSIDRNIEEKQHKLNKIQSLKKSLMQDLLTGKVRVKVN